MLKPIAAPPAASTSARVEDQCAATVCRAEVIGFPKKSGCGDGVAVRFIQRLRLVCFRQADMNLAHPAAGVHRRRVMLSLKPLTKRN